MQEFEAKCIHGGDRAVRAGVQDVAVVPDVLELDLDEDRKGICREAPRPKILEGIVPMQSSLGLVVPEPRRSE